MAHQLPERSRAKTDTAPPERVHAPKEVEVGKGAERALAYHEGMSRQERQQAELDRASARLAKLSLVGARRVIASASLHTSQVYLLAEEQGQNRERVLRGFNVSPAFRASFLTGDQHESAEATSQQAAGAES